MLSRFDTGPLVRMVCIEGWANAHGGPQITTATRRQTATRNMAADHMAAEPQPKQPSGLTEIAKSTELKSLSEDVALEGGPMGSCRFTLLKTQDVKAAASGSGLRNHELAIDHHRDIRYGGPLDRRRETAGLLQPEAGRRIGPGNTHLVTGGRGDPQRGHWSCRETGGELRRVINAIGCGGSDGVAGRDRSWEARHKPGITIIPGYNAHLPKVNLPLPITRRIARGISEELEQERIVSPAVKRPADAGTCPSNSLRKHRVVLSHVGARTRAARNIRIGAGAAQVDSQSAVGKDCITQDRVVGAAVPDADAGVDGLGERNPSTP